MIAWDLAGDWSLFDSKDNGRKKIRILGGRVLYDHAYATRNENVCLQRFAQTSTGVTVISRYISFNTPVELIPVGD